MCVLCKDMHGAGVKLPLHVPTSCGCSLAVMHQQIKVASSCFVLERNAPQSCLFQYVSHHL